MITRWYEVGCDYCGTVINHYIQSKPSNEQLREIGAVLRKGKIYCSTECYIKAKNKGMI